MKRRSERMLNNLNEVLMASFGVGFYSLWSVCGESYNQREINCAERQTIRLSNLVESGWDSIGKMVKTNS